jgi:hypothetical protein
MGSELEDSSQIESEDEEYLYHKENDETAPLARRKSKKCCGITPWLFITTFSCIFGSSFQFGYNIAVVNTPETVIVT